MAVLRIIAKILIMACSDTFDKSATEYTEKQPD